MDYLLNKIASKAHQFQPSCQSPFWLASHMPLEDYGKDCCKTLDLVWVKCALFSFLAFYLIHWDHHQKIIRNSFKVLLSLLLVDASIPKSSTIFCQYQRLNNPCPTFNEIIWTCKTYILFLLIEYSKLSHYVLHRIIHQQVSINLRKIKELYHMTIKQNRLS